MSFGSSPIVVVACSLFFNLEDARFLCTLETVKLIASNKVPVLCVDDSPGDLHDQVKDKLEQAGEGFFLVTRFKGEGKKGASMRQALREATAMRKDPTQRWVAVFSELEKVDFFNYLHVCCEPILQNQADIVTPGRDIKLFQETYAIEQFHSENLGNMYLNMLWKQQGGVEDLDWLFGPICWEGSTVGPFYLASNEEKWDAQMVPSIRASRMIGSRWVGMTIPYKHHPFQKQQEEGSLEFCDKRIMQVNLMTTVVGKAIVNEGKPPVVIVTGASGNIGVKVVNRLLRSDSLETMYLPPNMPASIKASIPVTKLRILLLDAQEPKDLASLVNTETNGGHHVEFVQCDLKKKGDWMNKFERAFCVFMLAARNPFPTATSEECYDSMLINSNVLEACSAGRVDRVVFASSNHLVGARLHSDASTVIEPDASPDFGTKFKLAESQMDSTLYAAAKAAGEAQLKAMVDFGRINKAIVLRIGWCQPGENSVETISVTGDPHQRESRSKKAKLTAEVQEKDKVFKWFRGMHLRNDDLDRIVDCCVGPKLSGVSQKLIHVNAVSDNPGMKWIVHGNALGYEPVNQAN